MTDLAKQQREIVERELATATNKVAYLLATYSPQIMPLARFAQAEGRRVCLETILADFDALKENSDDDN